MKNIMKFLVKITGVGLVVIAIEKLTNRKNKQ